MAHASDPFAPPGEFADASNSRRVARIVRAYADICQTIIELALEYPASVSLADMHELDTCLEMAIADAVAEHARLVADRRSEQDIERFGHAAHELRDHLNAAILAFQALQRGTADLNGAASAVLGRSLTGLRHVIDRSLTEARLAGAQQQRQHISVATFINDIIAVGRLHSADRGLGLMVGPVDPSLVIEGDSQLLTSAVMNLLQNGFKYTRPGGTVTLTAYSHTTRLLIEVQDQCGGIPPAKRDLFEAFGERHGTDRTGLGLGLSIARRAIDAHSGEIRVRNLPGQGCVFTIDIPLAEPALAQSGVQHVLNHELMG